MNQTAQPAEIRGPTSTVIDERVLAAREAERGARSDGERGGKPSLVVRMAERFKVDPKALLATLKATAFRQRPDREGRVHEPTNEEMMALLILADAYHLNPFTRELFAFYDWQSKGIVAVVSVDGWLRIINEQPTLRSLSFTYSEKTFDHQGKVVHEWIECKIVRSDRDEPIVIREYFNEVVRDDAKPWKSHPNRMHRHKTVIQAGRYAFGFGGIYDEDEAVRIIDGEASVSSDQPDPLRKLNAEITGDGAGKTLPAIEHQQDGMEIPAVVGRTIEAEAVERAEGIDTATGEVQQAGEVLGDALPPADEVSTAKDAQKAAPKSKAAKDGGPTYPEVRTKIEKAKDADALDEALSLVGSLQPQFHAELRELAAARRKEVAK